MNKRPKTIEWIGDVNTGYAQLIDQTRLPGDLVMLQCHDAETMWQAIKVLSVRGAPAIGIAAAYGLVLGIRSVVGDKASLLEAIDGSREYLASSRPTAVNLFWALDRMVGVARAQSTDDPQAIKQVLLEEAMLIQAEDAASCRAIGQCGAVLIPEGGGVLTHCNAGGLATGDYGTALALMYAAHEQGKSFSVFADETRPLLQGSRLTAWELAQEGIDVVTICDNMAAQVMKEGRVQCVVTGADRIAANGDTANKIGTYGVAVLARAHDIPFYVAAPASTFDLACTDGSQIPIELRDADEVRHVAGRATAPADISVYNPAFDVTPAKFIKGIVTDRGLIDPVTTENIARTLG